MSDTGDGKIMTWTTPTITVSRLEQIRAKHYPKLEELLVSNRLFCSFLFFILFAACGLSHAGNFDLAEPLVRPSPEGTISIVLKQPEKVIDFDVAKDGPEVAVLVQGQTGEYKVVFWDLTFPEMVTEWFVPKGLLPRALAWHPAARSFFLSGKQGPDHVIVRVNQQAGAWQTKLIYKTQLEIRRLVPAPRPFVIESDFNGEEEVTVKAYRIFFGIKNQDGTYAVKSITEEGKREYQAIGQRMGFTTFKDSPEQPSKLEARSALPLAFHPAGHILVWEDEKRTFQNAIYLRDHWETTTKLAYPGISGGTLTPTPNGIGLFHWQSGAAGVTLITRHGEEKQRVAAEYKFLSTPSSVPDGKGIVGAIRKDRLTSLVYVPVPVPLADVANAWMFAEEQIDRDLFVQKGGLLRDRPDEQLYSMYESEAYQCGGYDQSTPTRPYLVTTDVFWELLAAAYEGVFIVNERQQAIPAFWDFIKEADSYFRQSMPDSDWAPVFSTLAAMKDDMPETGDIKSELHRIRSASGREFSSLLKANADYGELKPRGHYDSSGDMQTYFKAFKYLTALAGTIVPHDDLLRVSPEIAAKAHSWITAYDVLIAPSRSPVVWRDQQPLPVYTGHPLENTRLFPLSWGMDNEVLLSTVYHDKWPEAEQIKGPAGFRLTPSGLDVAAALGSDFAEKLLAPEFEKYPPLRKTIGNLRNQLAQARETTANGMDLYNSWISALGLQWANEVASPAGHGDEQLWRVKRLQTGLASWATLRHATVLVNERTAAECGEAAFEPILLTPPRGYVEPDPKTFEAIAALFDKLECLVESWGPWSEELSRDNEDGEKEALRSGIIRRLSETAAKARLFGSIARKQISAEPIFNQEYEEILNIGRVAEHHFLIFKSLTSDELALSNPRPMPKIADVSVGGPLNIPFFMAAVGKPIEWDHIVPFFGRRHIVKGAVYSYYEFTSEELLNDDQWVGKLPSMNHPDWVSPFISRSTPSCPPQNPF